MAPPVVNLGVVGRGSKRLQLAPVAQPACARPARPHHSMTHCFLFGIVSQQLCGQSWTQSLHHTCQSTGLSHKWVSGCAFASITVHGGDLRQE